MTVKDKAAPDASRDAATSSLTPRQQRYLEWLALPKSARHPPTRLELANELGVTDRALRKWNRTYNLEERAADLALSYLVKHAPDVLAALVRGAKRGNHKDIKLFLELTGRYVEKKERIITGDVVITWDDAPD